MNTSSGNCMIMVSLVYSYMTTLGINWRLANNGDDCVLMLERSNLPMLDNLDSWFKSVGFTMAVEEPVDQLEQICFCQTRPVYTSRGYRMVREPWTAIPKDLTTRCDIKRRDVFENWCNSIRMGGQALAGDLPVYNRFYRMFKESHTHVNQQELLPLMETGFYRLSQRMSKVQFQDHICPRVRESFFLAFGITPPEQRALEREFQQYGDQIVWQTPYLVQTDLWLEREGMVVSDLLNSSGDSPTSSA